MKKRQLSDKVIRQRIGKLEFRHQLALRRRYDSHVVACERNTSEPVPVLEYFQDWLLEYDANPQATLQELEEEFHRIPADNAEEYHKIDYTKQST